MKKIENVKVSEYAYDKHFGEKASGGTHIHSVDVKQFEKFVNDALASYTYDEHIKVGFVKNIKKGYAPFCVIVSMKNFTNARTGTAKITLDNYQYLKSGYANRREGEFPVLSRWLQYPEKRFIPRADYLHLVLYSKKQMLEEHKIWVKKQIKAWEEKNKKESNGAECVFPFEFEGDSTEWGIVAVLANSFLSEEPLPPMTIIRNHLGKEFGGSGVELNPEKLEEYNDSVDFWSIHAIVK